VERWGELHLCDMTTRISRRDGLKVALAAPLVASARTKERAVTTRMPTLFLAHGAPPLLDMPDWMGQLNAWGEALPKPKSILVLSAHWVERPVTIGAIADAAPLTYDFYGFPERYYQQKYPSPGAPQLAKRVRALLEGAKQTVVDEPTRGLDHGAYVPLVAMYPKADLPVLQVSLPSLDPKTLFALGQTLLPLRDEGVLIIGSGFITHNLRALDWSGSRGTPQWATDFDQWTAEALAKNDIDALLDYQHRAPGVQLALPTHEHFVPLLVNVGAGAHTTATFPITGFFAGSFTKRSVQFG
jgi:4,5-DOPA dioxygenase extradiol